MVPPRLSRMDAEHGRVELALLLLASADGIQDPGVNLRVRWPTSRGSSIFAKEVPASP